MKKKYKSKTHYKIGDLLYNCSKKETEGIITKVSFCESYFNLEVLTKTGIRQINQICRLGNDNWFFYTVLRNND